MVGTVEADDEVMIQVTDRTAGMTGTEMMDRTIETVIGIGDRDAVVAGEAEGHHPLIALHRPEDRTTVGEDVINTKSPIR